MFKKISMFKKIAVAFVVLIAAVLLFAATRPDTFRVQRTVGMKAAPDRIFPHINDLRSFGAWSPYEKKDPNLKRSYSGAASGKGAVYAWEGNNDVGKGRMEITQSAAPHRIAMKLDFEQPFEAHNMVEFAIEPNEVLTEVTWSIHGPVPYPAKVMHLFFDIDDMVGKDFEAGLANLKAIAEQ